METATKEANHAIQNAEAWYGSIVEMLQALDIQRAGGSEDAIDVARETIEQSVLSVMVRDGWREPGQTFAEDGAEEYEILLTTGGPALRIIGRLGGYDEPETAELQMQDWGTPWTRFPAPEATLLKFAQCFYFGG